MHCLIQDLEQVLRQDFEPRHSRLPSRALRPTAVYTKQTNTRAFMLVLGHDRCLSLGLVHGISSLKCRWPSVRDVLWDLMQVENK